MDIDWENEFKPCKNVEDMWGTFIRKYENAVKLCIPKRNIGIRKHFKTPLDKESRKKLRSKKDKLWKELCRTGNKQTVMEYRRKINQVRKITRKAANQYEKNILHNIKENPKKFWSYVRKKIESTCWGPGPTEI